jgi:hypothetical protein
MAFPRPLPLAAFLTLAGLLIPNLAALTVQPPTFPELVAEADSILRGRVSQVVSQKVQGPDGPIIRTFVTFLVDAPLKGEAPRKVIFSHLGGRVGAERLEVPGMPRFEKGSRDVLFLRKGQEGLTPLVGVMHGRYRITPQADGQDAVARDNGLPLHHPDEVSLPMVTATGALKALASAEPGMSLAAFESAVREEIQRQAAAPKAP